MFLGDVMTVDAEGDQVPAERRFPGSADADDADNGASILGLKNV
jgi:hypothetical protein